MEDNQWERIGFFHLDHVTLTLVEGGLEAALNDFLVTEDQGGE